MTSKIPSKTASNSFIPTPAEEPPNPAERPPLAPFRERHAVERLSMPYGIRATFASVSALVVGVALGISHGGQMAGLRFRAENAHRLPDTPAGWYLYHKSKNYNVMLGGVKEGGKMGLKLGFWVGAFFTMEEAVDRARGDKRDFFSTVVAGLGTSGLFSLVISLHIDRWELITCARTARLGLKWGLGFGLLQDAISVARERRLGYVDFLLGRRRPEEE